MIAKFHARDLITYYCCSDTGSTRAPQIVAATPSTETGAYCPVSDSSGHSQTIDPTVLDPGTVGARRVRLRS